MLAVKRALTDLDRYWAPTSTHVFCIAEKTTDAADAEESVAMACWMPSYRFYSDLWAVGLDYTTEGGTASTGRVAFAPHPKAMPMFGVIAEIHQRALEVSTGSRLSVKLTLLDILWDLTSTNEASIIAETPLFDNSDVAKPPKQTRAPPTAPGARESAHEDVCGRAGSHKCHIRLHSCGFGILRLKIRVYSNTVILASAATPSFDSSNVSPLSPLSTSMGTHAHTRAHTHARAASHRLWQTLPLTNPPMPVHTLAGADTCMRAPARPPLPPTAGHRGPCGR